MPRSTRRRAGARALPDLQPAPPLPPRREQFPSLSVRPLLRTSSTRPVRGLYAQPCLLGCLLWTRCFGLARDIARCRPPIPHIGNVPDLRSRPHKAIRWPSGGRGERAVLVPQVPHRLVDGLVAVCLHARDVRVEPNAVRQVAKMSRPALLRKKEETTFLLLVCNNPCNRSWLFVSWLPTNAHLTRGHTPMPIYATAPTAVQYALVR